MTFQEVYEAWKADKQKTLRPATFSTYVFLVEKHILPQIADKGPIGKEDIDALREAIPATGVSEKTAYDAIKVLRGILRFASEEFQWPMPIGPISGKSVMKKPEFRLLSSEEQNAILDHIRVNRTPRNIGFYLALTTGVTVGELANLTWQDIDARSRVLHVRGIVSRYYKIDGDVRKWALERDNESSRRDIPLSDAQADFLAEEEGRHLKELFIMSNSTNPADARVIREAFKTLCKKLGLKGVQFKDARHSFAIRFLEAGGDYATLAGILGIGNVTKMVELYEPYLERNPRAQMNAMMNWMLLK